MTDGRMTDGHSKFGGYNMIIYIYIYIYIYINAYANFIEIRLFVLKILSKKCILDMNYGP